VVVRFGLYLPNEGPFSNVRLLAALARDAESAGWDGFFIWDALLPVYEHSDPVREALGDSGDVADVTVALTAIAAGTERIRFGPLVSALPRLRPDLFAKQTATLDQFSGGRLILGIGLGNPPVQFSAFGGTTDPRERAAMVDEFLDLLTQLWSGDTIDFHGSYYTARGVSMAPRPVQAPRIPIWVGADSTRRAPRRRAARWDGFVPASHEWPHGVISAVEYGAMAADIAAQRSNDTVPFDLVVIGNAAGTVPAVDDLEDYAVAGVTWVLDQPFTVDEARRRITNGPPRV
jgi:alkanesulfonate monooxygenase SsuD/methylene tetrahydromethanopterin reductase-like flavin-dependent oxidoreductase (luciferase family)